MLGWERERRTHFDEITENYDKIRPMFPNKLFADVLEYAGTGAGKKALEIGAGTGKATKPFLDAGYNVTAVELSKNMAAFLQRHFGENERFRVRVAAFEDVLLDERDYNLVYAATAFHWVDAKIGCPKVFRLLNSGRAFALFRYNAYHADGEALYEEIQALYKKYYFKPYKRPVKITGEEYWQPSEIKRGFGFESMEQFGFRDTARKLYESVFEYSADEYISLLETFSDHRALPESDREMLYNGIREAIAKHGGRHYVNYVFQLYMGRKP